ncbi:MAG: HNH endonuclease [Planctomycetes bacterium]|nr:HNH endonuclease [Planctomycetota bacterium]
MALARKRKRKVRRQRARRLGDDELLCLLDEGALRVDGQAGTAFKGARRLAVSTCHRGYLFVEVYHERGRRKIALHKLVWMGCNRQTVPSGYQIHHGDRGKRCNAISNLTLREAIEHGWYHEWKRFCQSRFPTYEEFREWKKAQPVDDSEF